MSFLEFQFNLLIIPSYNFIQFKKPYSSTESILVPSVAHLEYSALIRNDGIMTIACSILACGLSVLSSPCAFHQAKDTAEDGEEKKKIPA